MIPALLSATAAASLCLLSAMDASPPLYLYDKFLALSGRSPEQQLLRHAAGDVARVWIVGASSGIGAEMCYRISRAAYAGRNDEAARKVHLLLSARDERALREVAARCVQIGRGKEDGAVGTEERVRATPIEMDITSSSSVAAAMAAASAAVGTDTDPPLADVDLVLVSSGRSQLAPSSLDADETDDAMLSVNYLGPVRFLRRLAREGRWADDGRRRRAAVLSSVAGLGPQALGSSYSAAKHALHGYFGSADWENGSAGTRVDLPCPGPVATDIWERALVAEPPGEQAGSGGGVEPPGPERTSNKMAPDRAARLILASLSAPRYFGGSPPSLPSVMAKQPVLFFSLLRRYFPMIADLLGKAFGPLRVRAWEMGLDLYDPSSFKVAKKDLEQSRKVTKILQK